ncbi:MAG: peptidoglycan editing factor PgeF [Halofilum sp. (in: g-proteobacteria)]|nr:peptidoglycan editing factor PgeF [Halofilum sp. (in: g-proteobacteria)]
MAANRARLAEGLGLPAEPAWLRQVHGTAVVRADAATDLPEADAAWTDAPGVVCAVLTADCLPVVLAADDDSCVAVAHAGWRGLAAGVLEAAVGALPADGARLRAWLGPAIGPRAFEVGDEVRAAFVDPDPAAAAAFVRSSPDRWLADLYTLARRRLRTAGVTRIDGGGRCTLREPQRFFSHRRDGPDTGRMATLAWLAAPEMAP